VRPVRADRHRVLGRGAPLLAEAHVDRHLAALEARAHLVRAGARLLPLEAATRVPTLAGAEAAADALAVAPRGGGLQRREVQTVRHVYSSIRTRWRTFLSIPASSRLSVCSTLRPILPR